ncbi:ribonuclease III [Desulfolucanica intricata]|uniref:ribonuclease III n=1 Tax=Desulfolucanica intricata TaxID=1285191 RepID=UPI000837180F|nr:ribonuclease III [Desulfolucanica intricata]
MKKTQNYLTQLKQQIGVNWNDKNLLYQALTHSSYVYESGSAGLSNNQRLEFLGDAVLELLMSEHLYRSYPDYTEGELTKLRAAIVCEPSLAKVARRLGLGACLRMGKGEERSGGRERSSILADSFEALLGAVYLDQGLEKSRAFALDFLSPIIKDVIEGKVDQDYKTELQEMLQKKSPEPINYVILKEEGPDHQKVFTAGVVYYGKIIGKGTGRSKKEAEQQAAKIALAEMIGNGQTHMRVRSHLHTRTKKKPVQGCKR